MGGFSSIPTGLQVTIVALLVTPLLSLSFVQAPWSLIAESPPAYAVLIGATYWVVPWIQALLILRRSRAFFAVFALQCLLLGVESAISASGAFVYVRYALIILSAATLALLVDRDVALPLLQPSGPRPWRRSRRVPVNDLVRVRAPRSDGEQSLMIEDCSSTGLALFGSDEATRAFVGGLRRGDQVEVRYRRGSDEQTLQAEFRWAASFPHVVKIGLHANATREMGQLLAALGRGNPAAWRLRLAAVTAHPVLRHGVAAVFFAAFVGTMAFPALGRITGSPDGTATAVAAIGRTDGPAFDPTYRPVEPDAAAQAAACASTPVDAALAEGLFSVGPAFDGRLGRGELWLVAANGCWLFLTPDDRLYLWTGGADGTMVVDFGASEATAGAYEDHARLLGERAGTLRALHDRLEPSAEGVPRFHRDWAAGAGLAEASLDEKWLRAGRGGWLFLTREGDDGESARTLVWQWLGGPAENAVPVARLCGHDAWSDPRLLVAPPADRAPACGAPQ